MKNAGNGGFIHSKLQMNEPGMKAGLKDAALLMVLAAAFLCICLFPPAAKAFGKYGENLVFNWNAQVSDTEYPIGWTRSSDEFTVLTPASGWIPEPYSSDNGNVFDFYPMDFSSGTLSQTIDISNLAEDINAGLVNIHLSAETRKFFPNCSNTVILELLDGSGNPLGGEDGEHQASGTSYNKTWDTLTINQDSIPKDTRMVKITLSAAIAAGTPIAENYVQFDGISLILSRGVPITSASVGGLTAPTAGAAPITLGDLTAGDSSYTVTSLLWLNGDGSAATLINGRFKAGSSYKAYIELTAAAGYKFPSSGLTPSVNTGTPQVGSVSEDAEGNQLIFIVTFPDTAALAVTDIAVNTQPGNLSYIEGEALDLSGLSVSLTYNDTSTEMVDFAQFTDKGITATPAHGTLLTCSDHHGEPVTIACNDIKADTSSLTVEEATHTIALSPDSLNFSFIIGQPWPDAQTVTISNTGNSAVTISSAPTSANYFIFGPFPMTIPAGSTGNFTVQLISGLLPGIYSETITVDTVQETSGSINVTLTVLEPTYTIAADTEAIDFGSAVQGYASVPAAQTITITNTGNTPVTLTQPTAVKYTVSTLSALELAPSASATLTVQPKTGLLEGDHTEIINITGSNGAAAEVQLSFIVNPVPVYEISADPASISFGSLAEGYIQPDSVVVIVRNTGNQSISLYQPGAVNYVVGPISEPTLGPGDTSAFFIKPKPRLPVGNYNETVQIMGSMGVNAQVEVSFTCTEPNDDYQVTSGDGSAYQQDGSGPSSLTFTANGNVNNFTGLTINGRLVDKDDYDVLAGSTIIILHKDFLNTLRPGAYTLRFHYTDGHADASFVVQDRMPVTGDNNALLFFGSLMALSLAAIVALRRRRASRKT